MVLLVINVLLLVLGMVMEPGAILTLMLPVLLPIANGLGLDLVTSASWCAQPDDRSGDPALRRVPVRHLRRKQAEAGTAVSIHPAFLVPLILTLILVTYIPGIVTALPNALLS